MAGRRLLPDGVGSALSDRPLRRRAMRVKFYYSSQDEPGAQYPCDIQAALEKIQRLKAIGVDAQGIDVAGMDDVFRPYHAALTGPPATVRAVFGMRGALGAPFRSAT